ncbi:MAG TPA: hypothetical protein VNY80_00895 [Steroidobacteraceae bacterium]|jgi:hypothetical protein|nr:hypothetical protein [Steroidobacteraceae bacterium]
MAAKIDLLKSPNRRKRDRSLSTRITGSSAVYDSYQLMSWEAPLRWIRLATWLLVILVSLWDIAKTFGHQLGRLN